MGNSTTIDLPRVAVSQDASSGDVIIKHKKTGIAARVTPVQLDNWAMRNIRQALDFIDGPLSSDGAGGRTE